MTKLDTDSPGTSGKGRSHTIQSVAIAARFLNVLAESAGPMALRDIAAAAGANTPMAHRYMRSLVRDGLVRQHAESGHYDLGPAALRIGLAALRRVDVVEVAARHIRALTLNHGVSGGVAVWTDRGPTIVRWYRGPVFAITTVSLGDILPLDGSATGLTFQAYLPKELIAQCRKTIPRDLDTPASQRPTMRILEDIRARGGVERAGHIQSGVAGQAAPVFNAQNELACVITSVSPSETSNSEDALRRLSASAREASLESGHG
ncbi:MAG: IclR family transcriptional regulator [Pseudomonadota bacterium]